MYSECESAPSVHIKSLFYFMYCELIFAPVILLINLLLSLSLDYHSLIYSMHNSNGYLDFRR